MNSEHLKVRTLSNEEIAKGIGSPWEKSLLDTLNSLIDYEAPMRLFQFEKDAGMGKKNSLIEFVPYGCFLLFVTHGLNDEIVGTTLIRPIESGNYRTALLGFLHINKKYQRQGHGSFLMKQAEKLSINMGCQDIRLSVLGRNKSAKEFYDALNYTTTEVFMAKKLQG